MQVQLNVMERIVFLDFLNGQSSCPIHIWKSIEAAKALVALDDTENDKYGIEAVKGADGKISLAIKNDKEAESDTKAIEIPDRLFFYVEDCIKAAGEKVSRNLFLLSKKFLRAE